MLSFYGTAEHAPLPKPDTPTHLHTRKETLYIFIVLPADRYLTIYLYCCICYLNPLPNHTHTHQQTHTLLIIICRLRLKSTHARRDLRSHRGASLMESWSSAPGSVSQGAIRHQLDSFTLASDCIPGALPRIHLFLGPDALSLSPSSLSPFIPLSAGHGLDCSEHSS